MSPWSNDYVGGVLIGVAVFWGILAIFSNKKLIKTFPGILEWMPFLDPLGGVAGPSELTSKYIQGQSFHISSVIHDGQIHDRTFDDCNIYGPAVIKNLGIGQIVSCEFFGGENTEYFIPSEKNHVGVIYAANCIFKKCRFHDIGFLLNHQELEQWGSGYKTMPQDATES